ncbi:eukaryotic aspartyl protease family protein [Actinidia rufa]|uniref:Aspartic proteinase Asp1 n=1 Tax=Actinidia rufa TaxID=165716 RepID=A0A7J0DQS1_9ERIC|nr:eukaryotic aspartyl protease family protein [Actinidia rufa]
MNKKRKPVPTSVEMMIVFLVIFFTTFQGSFGVANQPHKQAKSKAANGFGSSLIFPVTGDVYPKGYYHVTLNIGRPPKPYFLDIDTGSDLTWLQCDAPCTKCTPAPHTLYKPNKDLVKCNDPLCASLHWPENKPCESPNDQCDYDVQYADYGSSMGVLVRDTFPLGCGYNQEVPDSIHLPYTDGVLGLANGKSSIVSQLHELGLTRNILGHCLSTKGGGFLFIGDDDLIPSSEVIWIPMLHNPLEKRYMLGPARLLYGRQATRVKGLPVVFDTGSTYSYFNSDAYKATLSTIENYLNVNQLKDAAEEQSLPVCWKGTKPFKSIRDVKNYFKPLILNFTNAKNLQLQLPPEAYLIITEHGNACLGILNGTQVGLRNLNILGDISLQDKMVIYDNEKQQIGWVPANCDKIPKSSLSPSLSVPSFQRPPETRGSRKEDL